MPALTVLACAGLAFAVPALTGLALSGPALGIVPRWTPAARRRAG